MQHTNSQRGADGQFSCSDAPKAKRIEVWLQPQTVALLDTLCKQWNVGRGKVIDHLVTRGPVPPAAWLGVEANPAPAPTPSAPSEPPVAEPEPARPSPIFNVGDQVGLLGFEGEPEPLGTVLAVVWEPDPITANDGKATFPPGWTYVLTGDYIQHELILVPFTPPAAESSPTPSGQSGEQDSAAAEPTPSDRPSIDWSRFQDPNWEVHQADAKAMGIKGVDGASVRGFKAKHRLPLDQRLSPDAQQLLRDERQSTAHNAATHKRVIGQRLANIRERLACNPDLANLIAYHCEAATLPDTKAVTDYLLHCLPDVGIKPYRTLCPGLWKALDTAEPSLAVVRMRMSNDPVRRALFWGVVMRLDQLDTKLPTDSDRFLEWCQFSVYQDQAHRQKEHRSEWLVDLLTGRLSNDQARHMLGLPAAGTDLTRQTINDAYKTLARQHHPDTGGDAAQFQRITEARDRLLLSAVG